MPLLQRRGVAGASINSIKAASMRVPVATTPMAWARRVMMRLEAIKVSCLTPMVSRMVGLRFAPLAAHRSSLVRRLVSAEVEALKCSALVPPCEMRPLLQLASLM